MSYIFDVGGGNIAVEKLTGNSGGAVGPIANNINIIGAAGIIVTGNPATHTLTVSGTGATYLSYTAVNSTPYIVASTLEYISVDSSILSIVLKFPNSASVGQVFNVKDKVGNCAANNITITTVGGVVNIDGLPSFIMNNNYEAVSLMWNGVSYEVF